MDINENSDSLNIEITEENEEMFLDQLSDDNRIATMDCMALNPDIAETVRNGRNRIVTYDLSVYRILFEDKTVFMLLMDDGESGDFEFFAERTRFYETEADAMAAMGAEYNDWITRF
jgi:hypothetical protein